MTGSMASMQVSAGENGQALKEIENKLPQLASSVEAIESILPRLHTGTISDYFVYQQVRAQYDQKDMLTAQAEQELQNIKTYEPNLEAEIDRCKANSQILQDKTGLLHTGKTINKITLAKNLQNEQLFRVEELYRKMQIITEKASRIIGAARSRVCPPYIPLQEKLYPWNTMEPTFPFRSYRQPKPDFSFSSLYSTETILDDLLKLKPINKSP
jgi:hypothetical protein